MNNYFSIILAGLLLAAPVFAQDGKARAIEPIRVQVTPACDDEQCLKLAELVTDELRRGGFVAFGARLIDYDVCISAAPLEFGEGRCGGVVSAMLIEQRGGDRRLSVHTGENLQELAGHLAKKLQQEFSRQRVE